MALDDSYLHYARRARGYDHDRYAWRLPEQRTPILWPGGATLACMVVVPIEHHPLNPPGKPFKHPGAMVTPYPDLRHYTTRDYGNRVGVYRILDALAAAGVKATFAVNALQLQRLRVLVDDIRGAGHEIAAHGLSTTHIHWGGLERATEAEWVAEARSRFTEAGLAPRTCLSPARQQSFATPDLIADAGFDICLDWEHDTVPLAMTTATARPLTALPLSNELDDRTLLIDRRQTEDEWVEQVLDATAFMQAESPAAGQVLGLTLTPYVSGQPFRAAAVRRLLTGLAGLPAAWCATASRIVDAAAT